MVPLGRTNKAACDVKLLPMTVLSYMFTVAVFVLHWGHGSSFSVPVDDLTRLWLPTHPPPIELIHDIGGVQKEFLKIQQY